MQSYAVIKGVLRRGYYFRYYLLIWFITVTIFIWLININLLAYIVSSPDLTATGKIGFIASAYVNYFKYLTNPTALTSVIFSLLVSINFTLILYLWKEAKLKNNTAGSNAGAFVAMIGSHCVSCGTSLFAPLVTAVAGSSTFLSAERANASLFLTTAANLLGIALVTWSIRKVTKNIVTSRLL